MTAYSDISHDRCHGLKQSMTRISAPDFTILPAYSVVQKYAGLKLVSGPHSTVRVSTAQYARVHESQRVRLERKYASVRFRSVLLQKSTLMGIGGVSNPAVKKP